MKITPIMTNNMYTSAYTNRNERQPQLNKTSKIYNYQNPNQNISFGEKGKGCLSLIGIALAGLLTHFNVTNPSGTFRALAKGIKPLPIEISEHYTMCLG